MSRRRSQTGTDTNAATAARVVVVSARRTLRDTLTARLRELGLSVQEAPDAAAAAVLAVDADVLLVDAQGAKVEWGVAVCGSLRGPCAVLLGDENDTGLLHAALRAGAAAVVSPESPADRLAQVIDQGAQRVRASKAAVQRLERRVRRLRALCRTLFRSRHELMRQVGTLCQQLSGSYREMTQKVKLVSAAGELRALLRQELDLESLLRTTLEYALRRLGPTNAAIFLPDSAGDYTLGAYVNYDCAREGAESLLDHLADVAAPAFEHRSGVVVMRTPDEIAGEIDRLPDWLSDSTMAAVACRDKDECAAVVTFFRDRRQPFSPEAISNIQLLAELFGEQLIRVIKTHHRHIPKDRWKQPGDGGLGPDDLGLAA